jgi:membrane protein DedA with SNARE-associated domain
MTKREQEPPLPTIVATSLFIMLLVLVWAQLTHHYEELISLLLVLLAVVEVTAVWIIRKYRNRKR